MKTVNDEQIEIEINAMEAIEEFFNDYQKKANQEESIAELKRYFNSLPDKQRKDLIETLQKSEKFESCFSDGHFEDSEYTLMPTGSSMPTLKKEKTLLWAIKQGNIDIVQKLLNTKGIEPNLPDKDGMTPLLWAIKQGNIDIAQKLMDTGKADFTARDWLSIKMSQAQASNYLPSPLTAVGSITIVGLLATYCCYPTYTTAVVSNLASTAMQTVCSLSTAVVPAVSNTLEFAISVAQSAAASVGL